MKQRKFAFRVPAFFFWSFTGENAIRFSFGRKEPFCPLPDARLQINLITNQNSYNILLRKGNRVRCLVSVAESPVLTTSDVSIIIIAF